MLLKLKFHAVCRVHVSFIAPVYIIIPSVWGRFKPEVNNLICSSWLPDCKENKGMGKQNRERNGAVQKA